MNKAKLLSLWLLIGMITFSFLSLSTPNVHASSSEWVTVWEDNFTDLNSIYVSNNTGHSIIDGKYFFNSSAVCSPFIRGLHTLPVFNLTITFTTLNGGGNTELDYHFELYTNIDKSQNSIVMAVGDPTSIGACFSIQKTTGGEFKFRPWKWWAGSLLRDTYVYTNQSANVLEMQFDGVNHEVSYTLDGSSIGTYTFYNRGNLTGSLPSTVFQGDIALLKGYVPDGWAGVLVDKISQRVYAEDSNVVAVAGKIFGLGFDGVYTETYNNALSIIDQYNGSATAFHIASGWSGQITWSQLQTLFQHNWEAGLHTGKKMKDDFASQSEAETWFNSCLSCYYGNISKYPDIWVALQHNENWTRVYQYAWQNHSIMSRLCMLPRIRQTLNVSIWDIDLVDDMLPWVYWAMNGSQQGGGMRSLFVYTHKVAQPAPNSGSDISTGNFTYILANATAYGYRIMPFYRGYKALLSTYNSNFTVTSSTSQSLVFSTSSGGYDVYVWAKKPSGSGTWHVYDDLRRKVKIWENLSDKVGFWVEHGRTYEVRPTKLEGSIESCSPHYANISSSTLNNDELTFTVSCLSGETSTIQVYCGNRGEPKKVEGANSWSYDLWSQICTLTVKHASSKQVVVSWMSEASGKYHLTVGVIRGGLPVFGANVTCGGETKRTDLLGHAVFELPYGFYTVSVTVGEETQTKEVLVSQHMSVGFEFESAPSGSRGFDADLILVPVVIFVIAFVVFMFMRKR